MKANRESDKQRQIAERSQGGEGEKKRGEEETEGRILKAEGEMDMEEETKSPQLYLW